MSPSKQIAHYGPKRGGIRVVISDDESTVIVKWRAGGERRQRSWPNSPTNRTEAKAWASGFAEELAAGRLPAPPAASEPLTMSALWDRYRTAEWDHLRPNTRRLYTEHWRYWMAFAGPDFPVDNVTLEMVDEFRKAQLQRYAVSVVNEAIRTVRRVYNWGDGRELVTRNRVARYRIKTHKDQRRESPAEYTAAEYAAILGALDPSRGDQWRACVALAICGEQGVRSWTALHLQWADLDVRRRRLTWRSAWDKMGREWTQPLRQGTVRALRVARDRARRDGYTGPWVLYPGSKKNRRDCYSAQSLWAALKAAERRAGVARLEGRGAHGLRRLLAGEVNALTGNPVLAMRSIGDTDVRQASRYLKDRETEQRDAFRRLDRRAEPAKTPSIERQPTDNEDGTPVASVPLTLDPET